MMQEFIENEYEIVEFDEVADVYVVNTCTVTNMADKKSRQMLRKVKELNQESVLVAVGCYAQVAKEELEKIPEIDLILGVNEKKNLINYVKDFQNAMEENKIAEKEAVISDVLHQKEFVDFGTVTYTEKTRAVIKVQDGCDRFCSYCIIPYARGRVRSRQKEKVVEEVQNLAENGYREIVLTGIHLSSYGMDFHRQPAEDGEDRFYGVELLELIRVVHEVEGIERIRLGSLEPRIITEEFVRGVFALPKVCPHFHLSLQSGCDATLRRMNRHYTSTQYYEKCELLRKYFTNPALTTDIIVGFPGETEEEFEQSYAFVEQVDFYETHIFKYSRREGTAAASMPGQVPETVKARRSGELLELGRIRAEVFRSRYIDREAEVLLEERKTVNGRQWLVGHTKDYVRVAVEDKEPAAVNRIAGIAVKGFLTDDILYGVYD